MITGTCAFFVVKYYNCSTYGKPCRISSRGSFNKIPIANYSLTLLRENGLGLIRRWLLVAEIHSFKVPSFTCLQNVTPSRQSSYGHSKMLVQWIRHYREKHRNWIQEEKARGFRQRPQKLQFSPGPLNLISPQSSLKFLLRLLHLCKVPHYFGISISGAYKSAAVGSATAASQAKEELDLEVDTTSPKVSI